MKDTQGTAKSSEEERKACNQRKQRRINKPKAGLVRDQRLVLLSEDRPDDSHHGAKGSCVLCPKALCHSEHV